VSHQPERTEKDCLNCGTLVAGRYCQNCGQENVVVKQSALALVRHFIYDIFHFDGKFFDTLKYLLIRPGFVPKQYVTGKRISYLDPIRMYLFTSAVFFLVFFSVNRAFKPLDSEYNRNMTAIERLNYTSSLHKQAKDSVRDRQLNFLLDTGYRMTLRKPGDIPLSDTSFNITLKGRKYLMVAEKRDTTPSIKFGATWLGRRIDSTDLKTSADNYESSESLKQGLDSFLHKLPYLLFVSLPFFAMFLKLLYIRRKNFYYSDHAVFTLYHYIFSFMLLLVSYGLDEIARAAGWRFFDWVQPVLIACGGIYLYIAMLRFYGQGWAKTLGKFLLLNILAFIMLVVLFLVFLYFSFFQN
jgi:hypothetical protein